MAILSGRAIGASRLSNFGANVCGSHYGDANFRLIRNELPSQTFRALLVSAHSRPRHEELRITLQKLPRWKLGSLSASTSAFTFPKVVSGLCLMPS
jgi:hypothetical protein